MAEVAASDELVELVFAALDHGIDSVRDGGPLIPFVLVEAARGRELARFASQTLEDGLSQAKLYAADSTGTRVAVAYDGYLTVDGERSDAVFVEAQKRGAAPSVIFAQRYRPSGRFRKFAAIGNAAFAGEGAGFF